MSNEIAALLANHVEDWADLADIDRPGVGAKISAVLAGGATTATLPIDLAVRVLGAVERPHVAAAGDQRLKVRRRLAELDGDDTGPAEIPAAATKLFTGDADDILATLQRRRSRLGAGHAAAWAACDPDTRSHLAATVLADISSDGAAGVVGRLADDGALRDALAGFAAAATAKHANSGARQRAGHVLRSALGRNLAAWLRDHHDGPWVVDLDSHHCTVPVDAHPAARAACAGDQLAAAAGQAGIYFRGPRRLAERALAALRARPFDDRGVLLPRQSIAVFTGADSGADWATIRRQVIAGDEPLPRAAFDSLTSNLIAGARDDDHNCDELRRELRLAVCADLLRAESRRLGSPSSVSHSIPKVLAAVGDRIDHHTALAALAATCDGATQSEFTLWWAGPVIDHLATISYTDIVDVVVADTDIAAYLDRAALAVASLHRGAYRSCADVDGSGTTYLAERYCVLAPVAEVIEIAKIRGDVAAAWARHCEQRIAVGAPGDTAGAWAALCNLATTFDGATDDLVDIAVATVS